MYKTWKCEMEMSIYTRFHVTVVKIHNKRREKNKKQIWKRSQSIHFNKLHIGI